MVRPNIQIPPAPVAPFPVKVSKTAVIPGFGRGSSDLGFPTANVSIKDSSALQDLEAGVYFGYAKLYKSENLKLDDKRVDRVDGWNPYYGNKEKTCEIYIIHEFSQSFYGADLSAVICGYLRPELDYEGIEALKKDIQLDVDIGLENLAKEGYVQCKSMLE